MFLYFCFFFDVTVLLFFLLLFLIFLAIVGVGKHVEYHILKVYFFKEHNQLSCISTTFLIKVFKDWKSVQ